VFSVKYIREIPAKYLCRDEFVIGGFNEVIYEESITSSIAFGA